MTETRVLLAGFSGGPNQNHQSEMWAPKLQEAGLLASEIWVPSSTSGVELEQAGVLAARLGLPLQVSAMPETSAACAIVCLQGEDRLRFLRFAAERKLPVLLDKPTLSDTAELQQLAELPTTIIAPHHFSAHPSFTRAMSAVRGAEFGLLRAVAVELVVAAGDGAYPGGELRNLGVYAVDLLRSATGPAQLSLQAHGTGESWSMLGQTDRDVVVSAHISRTSESAGGSGVLRAAVRFVGTHGSMLVDLMKPAFQVQRPDGVTRVQFGEDSVVSQLRALVAHSKGSARVTPNLDLVVLSRALDQIEASAKSGSEITLTW
ncbi:hypothetical protein QBL02_07635 [Leucobacter sp. UT-8R-CII-1-4]|uniref:hypothetical protein n=1 Tax=Leucobacter sp. UT-8R-CII-1-4 TaxID=3040075 RepID=UPI0024A998EE|nr:hypothetical protein [Leucobacter sp. UT-8R-CII-1-4]MDI6023414.1 hypothetical protein [Leucobacter sp. UT-8R-CII-1-4]